MLCELRGSTPLDGGKDALLGFTPLDGGNEPRGQKCGLGVLLRKKKSLLRLLKRMQRGLNGNPFLNFARSEKEAKICALFAKFSFTKCSFSQPFA
jgi:hypothetical protein